MKKGLILETQRLKLTPLVKSNSKIFHQININPHIRKYLWDDEIISLDTSQSILEECENRFLKNNWGLWAISIQDHENNNLIGYCGLWIFFDENQPQLIFALLPEYCRKGYAVEASQAIKRYAFQNLKFKYLLASTDQPNIASRKTCEKLGMQFMEEKMIDGKPTLFYRINNNEL